MNSHRRWLAPYVATLFAMLALQMSNLGFSPLLPAIRGAFHMSFAQIGLFAGMYGLLSVVWSVPAGLLAKRFGEKVVLAAGLLTVAAGLGALSQAPSFVTAFGARAVWLSGYRFSFVCVMVAVALTCPPSVRGASMGILGAISALASVIGAPLGGVIGRDFGWRNGILAYAGVALAGALVFIIFYRSDPDVLLAPAHNAVSASAFRSPLLWLLALLSGLAGMGSLSANFFVPSAAQALFHLDQVGASYLISTGFTLAIFVNLLFGFLMDRFHRWAVMAVLAGLGVLGGIAMTSHDLLVFRVGTALVLALGHAGIQQSYTLAADVLRGRETGNVMGVVSMVAGVFSDLGPQMLGLLRDWSGGFEAGWYFIIGAAAATLLLVLAQWNYSSRSVRQIATVAGVLLAISLAAPLRAQTLSPKTQWIEPGRGNVLPAELQFDDSLGRLGIVNVSGPVDTKGHPFFEPLGANGRACVTCHQPAYAMTISAAAIQERWKATQGKDPLFAAVDGSNCPDLPQEKESSHSLLLNRGLIRLAIPWPPVKGKPDFSIEVVSDPTGCNTSPTYGLHSAIPTVSVFRRPRMAANLKYVTNPHPQFALKLGGLADLDPETGEPVSMNFMADAREPSLRSQARNAALQHEERRTPLPDASLQRMVEFESQIYTAQIFDAKAGNLVEGGGPMALGPRAMAEHRPGVLGDNDYDPVFQLFDVWKKPPQSAQAEFRASVARGNDIFMFRQFWLRDATHINSIGLGNPLKRTCATCHNAQMTGQDLSAGWVDVGTTNYPTWTEAPFYSESRELPVFKITCDKDAPPHPYLGRVIYTSDPGRALISGRCVDVGSIVMQQFRGLAARAPYFSNGSMKSLRELVDFYDRRFDMKLKEQEKQDLVNFLGALMRPLLVLAMALPTLGQTNFVSCPVVRDTKTVPCFLAEYQGETYFLGIQQDITAEFYPPQLLHQVLVEGTVVAGPRVCGGIPLKPLHVSVMQELNRACNTILPAEPGIDAPAAKRPAGPSTRQAPVSTATVPPKKPEPPFLDREFTIQYDFDSDFLFARNTKELADIAEYARVSKAPRIEVTGYRASTLLSNGQLLIEKVKVSQLRAERVAEVLRGLGAKVSEVRWVSVPAAANGATDYQNRRVTVRIAP